jgi:hypothetical protein
MRGAVSDISSVSSKSLRSLPPPDSIANRICFFKEQSGASTCAVMMSHDLFDQLIHEAWLKDASASLARLL